MKAAACAKCASDQVIPNARVIDGRDYVGPVQSTNLNVGVASNPDAFIFTGEERSEVFARVCGKCGFTELYVENPEVLYSAHLAAINRK